MNQLTLKLNFKSIPMNKQELISALASKTGKPQTEAKAFLEAFTDTVGETLAKGDKITLIGFVRFRVSKQSAGFKAWALN